MFELSHRARRVTKGEIIEGTIVAIGEESALIDVGSKSEAEIDIDELADDNNALEIKVGDRIQAMVVSTAGGLRLSRKLAFGAASARQLQDAFHSGLPGEGKVERGLKGGYEVRIARQRAFCPFSQIDIRSAGAGHTDAQHEGHVYRFRIIEYKDEGRNIVVSRRVLLEEEQQASAAEFRKSVQGLLHVSEMAWERVPDASHFVRAGDEITVKVLRVDSEKQKIALGLKQLAGDPWSSVGDTYQPGQVR